MKSWNWTFLKELVKSFSLYENNYMKAQILTKSDNVSDDYSKVFKNIFKENAINEVEFKRILNGKNISLEKAKFIKNIFTHLRNFHEDDTLEIRLHNALCDIEILFTKQLYEFCYEVVNYNIEISEKYQMYELTLLFTKWKRKCLTRIDSVKLIKNQLNEIKELEKDCFYQLNLLFELRGVQQEILQIINKKGTSFDEDDKKRSLELLSQLNIDSTKINSITAYAMYNEINSWIAFYVHNDNLLSLKYNTLSYNLFKKHKYQIAVYPQVFLAVYCSFYKRSFLNKKENSSDILKEIKEMHISKKLKIPEDVRVQAFVFSSEFEMLENINAECFQNVVDLFKQNKKFLSKHSSAIKKSFLLIQNYCAGLAHFHLKGFTTALKFTKMNIDNFNDSIRLDFYMYNLTLNFIIHIELENIQIYNHLYSTYKRTIKKHDLQETEVGIYGNFFQQIVKNPKPDSILYLRTYEALHLFDSNNDKGAYDLHVSKWFKEKYQVCFLSEQS